MYRESLPSWIKHLDFILLDLLTLHLAFMLACFFRLGMILPYTSEKYRLLILIMTVMQLLVSVLFQSFKGVLRSGYYKEAVQTLRHVVLVLLCTIFYLFATKRTEEFSRLALAYTGMIYFVLSLCIRIIWRWVLSHRKATFTKRSLVIITTEGQMETAIAKVRNTLSYAYWIAAVVLVDAKGKRTYTEDIPVIRGETKAFDFLRCAWVDEAIIMMPEGCVISEHFHENISRMGVVIHTVQAERYYNVGKRQVVEKMGNFTVLTEAVNVVSPGQLLLKRLIDICGALVGCFFTLLLTAVLGPIIYHQSPGPIFFVQERVGKNGKKFKFYKFRSMYMDAEKRKKELMERNRVKDGMMFKMEDDPRIIGSTILPDGTYKKGIGNFIRDTSLDEFPQFFNVLKGDMSLVGTRPPTVDEWGKYQIHHHARLATKPGITGMWQCSGRSQITDFEEVVRLDTQYIRQWSIGLDLKILFKTVAVVFKREGSM